jgi:hypothetical protein
MTFPSTIMSHVWLGGTVGKTFPKHFCCVLASRRKGSSKSTQKLPTASETLMQGREERERKRERGESERVRVRVRVRVRKRKKETERERKG